MEKCGTWIFGPRSVTERAELMLPIYERTRLRADDISLSTCPRTLNPLAALLTDPTPLDTADMIPDMPF